MSARDRVALLLLDVLVGCELTVAETLMVASVGLGSIRGRELMLDLLEAGAIYVNASGRVRLTAAGHWLRDRGQEQEQAVELKVAA